MIYAKLNPYGEVLEYPLSGNDVRKANLDISLPLEIDEQSLPYNYARIVTKDLEDIPEKYLNRIKEELPVRLTEKTYQIDTSLAILEGVSLEDPYLIKMALVRKEKIAELVSNVDSVLNTITQSSKIPSYEKASWDLQSKEALNFIKDSSRSTPLIDGIAEARGVDKNLLIDKVIYKSNIYKNSLGFVLGVKQNKEDLIEGATTLEELEGISTEISVESIKEYLHRINLS